MNKSFPTIKILAQSAVPVILVSSGTFNATGGLSGLTALPYVPFGTVKVVIGSNSNGIVAGVYNAQFSSTTACQLTDVQRTLAGAYTAPTTMAVMNYTQLPGSTLGIHGGLRITPKWTIPNNANNKTIGVQITDGTNVCNLTTTFTTTVSVCYPVYFHNRGTENNQYNYMSASSNTAGAMTPTTVDTHKNCTINFRATMAAATDYVILEGYTVELMHAPQQTTFANIQYGYRLYN